MVYLLICTFNVVLIVIVVAAATVRFKKRRGRMEVTTGNIYSPGLNMVRKTSHHFNEKYKL